MCRLPFLLLRHLFLGLHRLEFPIATAKRLLPLKHLKLSNPRICRTYVFCKFSSISKNREESRALTGIDNIMLLQFSQQMETLALLLLKGLLILNWWTLCSVTMWLRRGTSIKIYNPNPRTRPILKRILRMAG